MFILSVTDHENHSGQCWAIISEHKLAKHHLHSETSVTGPPRAKRNWQNKQPTTKCSCSLFLWNRRPQSQLLGLKNISFFT